MHSIFRDDSRSRVFIEQGYLVLPFLTAAEVAHLCDVFADMHPHELSPFYVTTAPTTGKKHRRAVHEAVRPIFEPKLAAIFDGFKLGAAVFFVKEPGREHGLLPLHVDPSHVDERRFVAVTFWCPLVDVDGKNGCLEVVPGSHYHVPALRPYGDTRGAHPFRNVLTLLEAHYTRQVAMKAGEILFFYPRLMHGSGPNKGSKRRVAVGGGVAPHAAQWQYPVMISPTQAEVFAIDPEFFWSYRAGERPTEYRSLAVVEHRFEQLTDADILRSLHLRPW